MKRWRKVLDKDWNPTTWTLRLECGHDAYRSSRYTAQEVPDHVLCQACNDLIGSPVKTQLGKFGVIAGYHHGQFDVEWNNDGSTRWTLDKLREELEIL